MSNEFINVMIRMNLVGMYGILLILAIRFLLKKISYRYVYMLWLVVFGLLVVPVRFSNGFSLVPKALDQPYVDVRLEEDTTREFTYVEIDSMNNHTMPYRGEFAVPSYTESKTTFPWETVLNILWFVGCLTLILWELGRTVRLYRYIHKREIIKKSSDGRIVTLKGLDSSFVFGFLRPTIYLSDDMTAEERTYILAHEQYHCKRKDPLIKTLAMLITFIYWYNPIVWLGYHFFCVDMELSCDEAVLKKFSGIIKKDYAASLLKYGALQNRYIISAMTFGQPNLKSRIKNVLNYKRKNIIFTIIALVVVAAVAVGLFSRNAVQEPAFEELTYQPENLVGDWEIDVEMTESKLKETSLFELFGTGFSYGNGLTITDDGIMNYCIGISNEGPDDYLCQYESDEIICTNQSSGSQDDILHLRLEKNEQNEELLSMEVYGEIIYWRKKIIEESDDFSIYEPVLTQYRDMVANDFYIELTEQKDYDYEAYRNSFGDYVAYEIQNHYKENVFYAFYDIDRNGIEELVIAAGTFGFFSNNYDLYTYDGEQPVRLFPEVDFGYKTDFELLDNHIIKISHSVSAQIYVNDFYKYTSDNATLERIDSFHTDSEKEGEIIRDMYFRNGEEITEDEFYSGIESYGEEITLDWKKI